MNREDIIRMAREQGLPETATEGVFIVNTDDLGRMLLVEREACAKDLDEASEAAKDVDPQGFVWRAVKECAAAIRARGQ
jgi:hypothetical protein